MKIEYIFLSLILIISLFTINKIDNKTVLGSSMDYNEPAHISQTTSTVGNYPAVKTVIMASSSARSYAIIKNDEAVVDIYIHLGDATATLANSHRLKPTESFVIDGNNLYRGRITAFASSATATAISILEAW